MCTCVMHNTRNSVYAKSESLETTKLSTHTQLGRFCYLAKNTEQNYVLYRLSMHYKKFLEFILYFVPFGEHNFENSK